jgi:A/G-specific adenine glycosylase
VKLPPGPRTAGAIRRRLLAFFDGQKRELPWRLTTEPYRILVSEFMLQQTTVAAVLPYYARFMQRFPTLRSLARASEDDVLSLWSGLGYYARARNLLAACRAVEARHGGRIPSAVADLLALPGIGPYTAGAMASIAFGKQEPVVDGNVRRVLSRLGASHGAGAAALRSLEATARALVAGPRPGDLNQALMEFGATICSPRSPGCPRCPLRRFCSAAANGAPEAYPRRRTRPPVERRRATACLIRGPHSGFVLVRRPRGGVMPGLWELPGTQGFDPEPAPMRGGPGRRAAALAARQIGRPVRLGARVAEVRQIVLAHDVRLEVREASVATWSGGWPSQAAERQTMELVPGRRPEPPLTAMTRKALIAGGVLLRERASSPAPDLPDRLESAGPVGRRSRRRRGGRGESNAEER